ncbi:MAG: response regulator [Campylobacteraceae bacterium]|nr:response regulator [Campylobacteraceae bacterium]
MDYNTLTKKELITIIKEMKIQSNDNSRDIFISNISHDVRTLLNSIYGHTQILSKNKFLNDEQEELIDKILDASTHMIDLINEIINISKNVGLKKLNISDFELNTLITNIYSIFESIALSKNIKIVLNNELQPDFIIKSDKNKLFYILLNIVGNAIKFTHKGSVVFNCKKKDDNSILFEVIDTGVGIEKSMQEKIFENYIRTQESNDYEGNGLGLAIANKNIIALGSELKIDSMKNEGSKFSFVIKCESSKENFLAFNKEVFELKEIKSLKKNNELFILIGKRIDKEKSILESYLNSKKIKYEIFNKEDELLNYLQNKSVDMIFLDTNLGNNNSIDIVKHIQKTNKKLPLIALTASVMSEDLKLLSQYFTNYIIKPYSFSDIEQALIFFSGKEFEFEDKMSIRVANDFIVIEDEALKQDILKYAKLGQYKKLSQIMEKINNQKSKKVLKKYLNNYNFEEIINKIEADVL